ncbi:MAG: GNAT family N-acetyltransferase [Bacteroidetes bacterium]|nr:GNAT family N-acetyltransferase [Bacteroidota bacterium]
MPKPNLYIETERLLIRPFTPADIDAAYAMNLDTEVSRYTGDGGVVSREEMERRIHEDVFGDYEKHGFGRLAVELKSEQKFIGFTGLKYLADLKEVDLGYRFMSPYWGKGYATESAKASLHLGFETLDLDRIIAMVLPENKASIRVLEKLNFVYEKDIVEEGMLARLYALSRSGYLSGFRRK